MTPANYAACSEIIDREREFLDYQFAMTRMWLVEPHRDRKKRPTAFEPSDFSAISYSYSTPSRKEMSPEQQRDYVVNFLHPLFKGRAEMEKKKLEGKG